MLHKAVTYCTGGYFENGCHKTTCLEHVLENIILKIITTLPNFAISSNIAYNGY